MKAERQRRNAVGQPHRDHPERPAPEQRYPHQRDVMERVAEFADRHGYV